MPIRQGDIYVIRGSPWIVVDSFHNSDERHRSLHCAPLLDIPELRLTLDVSLSFEARLASLSLIQKQEKRLLANLRGSAHAEELELIRSNLVTYFSVFSFDFNTVRRLPDTPEEPPSIYPGMIFRHKRDLLCIVDHWGCFNDYPLVYVAPVLAELVELSPLDIDISSEFRDLFGRKYVVRTDDFFFVERKVLDSSLGPQIQILGYGLVRRISRALVLKFGQLTLLL